MNEFSREVNALIIYILSFVLIGAFIVEFYYHQTPCPLCFLQRLGMIGIASGELLNIRFGVRISHYALSLLGVAVGITVSIRHILLHLCPGTTKAAFAVFGFSLYVWAFIIFICTFLGTTLLLFCYRPKNNLEIPKNIGIFPMGAFILIALITFGSVFDAFMHCGLGPNCR